MKYPWSVFAGPGVSKDMVAVMIFALAPPTCPQSASPFSSGKVPVSSPPHRSRKTHFVDTLGLFHLLQLRKSATRGRPPWAPKKLLPGASLCQIFQFFLDIRVTRRNRHLPKKHYPAQRPHTSMTLLTTRVTPSLCPKRKSDCSPRTDPGKSRISLQTGEEISDPRQENCFSTLLEFYLCLWDGVIAHTILFSTI